MKRKGRFLTLLAVLLVLSFAGNTAFASGSMVNGKYWQGPIQFFKNNSPMYIQGKPIILNNVAYLPVRDIAEALGMNVEWVEATAGSPRKIMITDSKPDISANTEYFTKMLSNNEAEIKSLKAKVESLEKDKKDLSDKLDSANKDLEKVKKDFEEYKKSPSYPYYYNGFYNNYYNGDSKILQDNLNRNLRSASIDGNNVTMSYSASGLYNYNHNYYNNVVIGIVVEGYKGNSLGTSADFISFLQNSVMGEVKRGYYFRTTAGSYYNLYGVEFNVKDLNSNSNFQFYADSSGYVRLR